MQAVILAGGRGTRLRPLTDKTPKSMIQVGEKMILEHTLGMLPPKIEEAILVVGYKKEKIKKHFGDSFYPENTRGGRIIKITYVEQPEPSGTADALMRTRPYLRDGIFLLLSGDDLYHEKDLEVACENDNPLVLVMRSENPERFGVCAIGEGLRLLRIVEKPKNPQGNLVNIGAYLLNNEIFDIPIKAAPNGEFYLAEQVGNWAKERPVHVHEALFWHPINNYEELRAAEKFLASGK